MHRPTVSTPAAPTRLVRRVVLGTAFLLGLAAALAPRCAPMAASNAPPISTMPDSRLGGMIIGVLALSAATWAAAAIALRDD